VIGTDIFDEYISVARRPGASDNTTGAVDTRFRWDISAYQQRRKVWDHRKLRELAAITYRFGCVMKVPTRQQDAVSTDADH